MRVVCNNLYFHCEGIAWMVYFQMFIVVGFCGWTFATNCTLERSFSSVNASVFYKIVMSMERFLAQITGVLFIAMMLSSVAHIIIFPYKLTSAYLACVRLYLFMWVHMIFKINFAHKSFWAVFTFKWFGCAIGMYPGMNFQIPLGWEWFIANRTIVLSISRVGSHMSLHGSLGKYLLTNRTLHGFGVIKFVWVCESDMTSKGVYMYKAVAAMRTALGFRVMSFLMPQKPCFRWQHFSTIAHIFLSSNDLFRMSLAMLR